MRNPNLVALSTHPNGLNLIANIEAGCYGLASRVDEGNSTSIGDVGSMPIRSERDGSWPRPDWNHGNDRIPVGI